jgi:hypothetical protein
VEAGLAVPAQALDEAGAVLDAAALTALRASSSAPSPSLLAYERRPSGSVIVFAMRGASRQRILELDRAGALAAVLRWTEDALAEASVRVPDGRWVTIEPRAQRGSSDRLWLGAHPGLGNAVVVATFDAVDYTAVRAIPVLADPSRLPPGAGTTVLNLLASLAEDQQRRGLRYAGPYPTEQLFLALLESFRYVATPEAVDPLAAFIQGELAWDPAPHERATEEDGLVVQRRDRVEKVVWEGRTYYRADWQGIARHAPRRIRDDAGDVVCSLWALGGSVEDHLRLSADGRLLAVVAPASSPSPGARPLGDAITRGVVATIAGTCIPALAPSVRAIALDLTLAWAAVDRDLVRVSPAAIELSTRLRTIAAGRVRAATDRETRLMEAFALIAEIASLAGDSVRARAQAHLAARSLEEQETLLALEADPERESVAGLVAAAVEAVLADLTSG